MKVTMELSDLEMKLIQDSLLTKHAQIASTHMGFLQTKHAHALFGMDVSRIETMQKELEDKIEVIKGLELKFR